MQEYYWKDEPLVLLVGHVDHEGVVSALTQSGRRYKKKVLDSKASNWASIIDLLAQHTVSAVLVKLTPLTYRQLLRSDYAEVADILFEQISTVPHAVFVYEGLFTGKDDSDWGEVFDKPNDKTRIAVNELLAEHNIHVLTYKKNAEVTVLALEFLSQTETGLLLRLYVPNAQLWANETDRLLQLFRDYLTRIAGLSVRLDETRTNTGVIYELRGDPEKKMTLSTEFDDFSHFMQLCVTNPNQAELILKDKQVASNEILQILTRYAKEVRRLQVDMKQDREQKILHIRHRLESELVDALPTAVDFESLGELVDAAVPTVLGPRTPLLISIDAPQTRESVTLNINPQFVETVHGVVTQEISGDVTLNENDTELFRLFATFAGDQQAELVSALRELNDESAPSSGRLTAKHNIKRFLLAIGSKATEVGIDVLKSYIEKKMLGL